ncbi:MAG: hypothetical protein JJT75_14850 [Opitutales bacterium]|nr:hypothetical protein [Opitutales bacterium]
MNEFLNLHFDSNSRKYLEEGSTKVFFENKGTVPLDDGISLSWEWDGTSLQLNADPYGTYPGFYSLDEHNFSISTTLHRIVKSTKTSNFDLPALSVYLSFGYFIGGRTHFKEIQKRLPAKTFTVRLSKPNDPLGDEAVARQLSEACGIPHSTLFYPKFSAHSAELVKNCCCGIVLLEAIRLSKGGADAFSYAIQDKFSKFYE